MNYIYKDFRDVIASSLVNGARRGSINKAEAIAGLGDVADSMVGRSMKVLNRELLFESLQPLSEISGKKAKPEQVPGAHPDFKHITSAITENHYITTMFIDIKRSTSLFKKYEPPVVAYITSTLQMAAIHTAWYFDGYIHRFHGDGLMIYFGGKNVSLQTSVNNAITAASFFSYFMENDLKNIFTEQGVDQIFTRIGIDVGFDEDVYWYKAGMGDCGEITTCSLHTSLAAHMQGYAGSNGIVVGDNIKNSTSLPHQYFKANAERRYIFEIPEEGYRYTQWEFNWNGFLKEHPSLKDKQDNDAKASTIFVGTEQKNIDYLRTQAQGYRPYYE